MSDIPVEMKKFVKINHMNSINFLKKNRRKWKKVLDLLIIQIVNSEKSLDMLTSVAQRKYKDLPKDFMVMQQIASKSLRVSREVFCMLENGFSEAGLSRWRTLYELEIIIQLISDYPEQTLNEFLDHYIVNSYKVLKNQEEHIDFDRSNLGYLKYKKDVEKEYSLLKTKYKDNDIFFTDYGWLYKVLPNNTRINFSNLMKMYKDDLSISSYKRSCIETHSNSFMIKNIMSTSNFSSIYHDSTYCEAQSDHGLYTPLYLVSTSLGIIMNTLIDNCLKINDSFTILKQANIAFTEDMRRLLKNDFEDFR